MPLPHTPLGSSNSSSDAHERESYLQALELAWMMGAEVEVEVFGEWVPVPEHAPGRRLYGANLDFNLRLAPTVSSVADGSKT